MKTIQQARKEKGLTQFDLAVKVGVQPTTISEIERGIRVTTLKTLCSLCKVLELDPNEVEGIEVRKRVGRYGWRMVERPFNVTI